MFAIGNTLCIHSHIDDNGERIVHSHPFRPAANHTHTAAQYASLAFVNQISYDNSFNGAKVNFNIPTTDFVTIDNAYNISVGRLDHSTSSLRGPPAIV